MINLRLPVILYGKYHATRLQDKTKNLSDFPVSLVHPTVTIWSDFSTSPPYLIFREL